MNKTFIDNITTYILDIIFPIYCLSCNKEGEWICPECFNKITIENNYTCPKCRKITKHGAYCKECEITSKMKGMIVASSYENKLLQKLIRNFKYKYITNLKYPLGKILTEALKTWNEDNFNEYIVTYIPLHKKKQKRRGFNQAELLAQVVSEKLKIEYQKDIIYRIKNTSAQASLSPLKRRKNIKNAFKLNSSLPDNYLAGKKILLVDDVCTTSSTLEECAKELSKQNPEEIWGLVLARGK